MSSKAIKLTYLLMSLTITMPPLASGAARAQVCGGSNPIPQCFPMKQPPVHLTAWKPTGWAFYCPAGMYHYGLYPSYTGAYSVESTTHEPSCITAAQNIFLEADDNKFDATFDNWCGTDVDMIVTIGCSWVNPDPPCGEVC